MSEKQSIVTIEDILDNKKIAEEKMREAISLFLSNTGLYNFQIDVTYRPNSPIITLNEFMIDLKVNI